LIHGNVEMHNIEEMISPPDGKGMMLSRIPNELRTSVNDPAKEAALAAAGGEIRFNLEGPSAKISLTAGKEPPALVEIFQGCFLVAWRQIGPDPTEITVSKPQNMQTLDEVTKQRKLPFDPHLTRVILPYWPPVRLVDIQGETSLPGRSQTPKETLLTYGSSITHGAWAIRPTGSYAMRMAQMLGVDLVNLGFGGGAHCEGQMADYIARRRDWDLATLEIGINMMPNTRFSTEEFERRVRYFVRRIAKSHPRKWVFCTDMFTFNADLAPTKARHVEFRRIVREAVRDLGMPRLVHVDGRTLLREVPGLSFDLVHPSPQGMEEIARSFSRFIKRKRHPTS